MLKVTAVNHKVNDAPYAHKREGICPFCGADNGTTFRADGQIKTGTILAVEWKCKRCEKVWHEVWQLIEKVI